jgi:hypothetical protein
LHTFAAAELQGGLFWWGQRRLFFGLAVILHLPVEFGKLNSSVAKLVKDLSDLHIKSHLSSEIIFPK